VALSVKADVRNVHGVVITYDNDDDSRKSFLAVQNQIRKAESGYGVPKAPLEVAPSENDLPSIVALPIPGVDQLGSLETLILPSVSDSYPDIRKLVDEHIAKTPANHFGASKRDKAILAMMVASICKSDPTCSIQNMWSKKEFKNLLGHSCFNPLAEFLRDLANIL
jgi:hypothetical protein